MALAKKKKRLLSYVVILGGLAVLSLTFFTISQFEKAKCEASESTLNVCNKWLNKYNNAYIKDNKAALIEKGLVEEGEKGTTIVDREAFMAEFLADTSSPYRDAAEYWNANYVHFKKVDNSNAVAYKATCFPAYILSMATLVSFGLILKHAEKAKEKEDEEAVLG